MHVFRDGALTTHGLGVALAALQRAAAELLGAGALPADLGFRP